ncbi:hypothetical protein [Streptomyces sp. NPDC059991]|uniref:hypothetical protein n=1 Tax=unclassified Streptomyces TaxID=2593676 RepID=UPI0036967751
MVILIVRILRTGPFLLTHVAPFLLLTVGVGSAGWAVKTYGASPKILPGLALAAAGLAIAHLGAWHRRTRAHAPQP